MNKEIILKHLSLTIFEMNSSDLLITDYSLLSDFSGSGLTNKEWNYIADQYDNINKKDKNYDETEVLYNKIKDEFWNNKILKQLENYYNINIKTTDILLSEILIIIEKKIKIENLLIDLKKQENNNSSISDTLSQNNSLISSTSKIKENIDNTMSGFFYAKHANVSLSEAMDVIIKRKNSNKLWYQPRRMQKNESEK